MMDAKKTTNYLKAMLIIKKKIVNHILAAILLLMFISLIIAIWLPLAKSFILVFGSFYILFLSGFVLSYAFFPLKGEAENKEDPLDIFERVTLSFVLSISCVSLAVFYANLIGIKITLFNVLWEVALIIVAGLAIVYWRFWRKKEMKRGCG